MPVYPYPPSSSVLATCEAIYSSEGSENGALDLVRLILNQMYGPCIEPGGFRAGRVVLEKPTGGGFRSMTLPDECLDTHYRVRTARQDEESRMKLTVLFRLFLLK